MVLTLAKTIYDNLGKEKINLDNYSDTELSIIVAEILKLYRLDTLHKINSGYKNDQYYNLLYHTAEMINKMVEPIIIKETLNDRYLEEISKINKGYNILLILDNKIKTLNINYSKCGSIIRKCTFNSFLYWYKKNIDILNNTKYICQAFGNTDDRIFKYLLKNAKIDRLKTNLVSIVKELNYAIMPIKYKIKRIKLLHQYLDIDNDMITTYLQYLDEIKIIYYIISSFCQNYVYTFDDIQSIRNQCKIDNYNELYNLLPDIESKYILNIIMDIYDIDHIYQYRTTLLKSIIIKYYDKIIILGISLGIFNKCINYNCNVILKILSSENLINKFYNECKSEFMCDKLLLFTKFLTNDDTIKTNMVLHLLRICIKKRYNKKIKNHLTKYKNLNHEINYFLPSHLPVLKNGSNKYQYEKQKFTFMNPKYATDFSINSECLVRQIPSGLDTTYLPDIIYPPLTFNANKVRADYIEEYDLYLIYDIDVPDTTIQERYDMLCKHPYYTKCDNLDDEKEILDNFIKITHRTKWFPKLAIKCDFKSYSLDLFKNYNGILITPLNGEQQVVIKNTKILSIDLLYKNMTWLDSNNNDYSHLIINDHYLKNNKIYRCYLDNNMKFYPKQMLYNKDVPTETNTLNDILCIIDI